MSIEQPGRTAPWAKALGAVLLALLVLIIASYVSGNSEEADREHSAFEDTREDARRFAEAVASRDLTAPIDRQTIQGILNSTARKGGALLFTVEPANTDTRVIVQFSRSYTRALHLFGSSEATVRRCFTIVLSPDGHASITAHGVDESCRDIARSSRTGRPG